MVLGKFVLGHVHICLGLQIFHFCLRLGMFHLCLGLGFAYYKHAAPIKNKLDRDRGVHFQIDDSRFRHQFGDQNIVIVMHI
jgi:hypothetical protein